MQGYTRRQLKQDKFAEGTMSWASEHQQTLLWSIGVLLIVAVAAISLFAWNSRQTDQANLALSKAIRIFNAPLRQAGTPANEAIQTFTSIMERSKAAEKQFKDVADKYSLTKPGKIAGYMAGVAAMQAGDNAIAEKQLKSSADARDKDIAALAKMALATLYRSTNRQSDAANIYKDLADHPTDTVSKPAAQLELASMYESTDPKQAANLYQQIQKENPSTRAAQIAGAKLNKGENPAAPSF